LGPDNLASWVDINIPAVMSEYKLILCIREVSEDPFFHRGFTSSILYF
jgi:hypothetical protein